MSEAAVQQLQRWADNPDQDWSRIGCVVGIGLDAADLSLMVGRGYAAIVACCPPGSTVDGVISVHSDGHLRTVVSSCATPASVVHVLAAPDFDGNEATRLRRVIDEAVLQGHVLAETIRSHNVPDIEHGLRVLPHLVIHSPVSVLSGLHDGRPGVVVGAGPSLPKSLDRLAEIQGSVVIAATNTAVPVLEAAGISPDVICCADGHPTAYKFASEADSWRTAIRVVHPHAHPMVWDDAERGVYWLLSGAGSWCRWLKSVSGEPMTETGGSVSTLCYSTLRLMGCSTIALVGMDCALSGDQMYAAGTERDGGSYEVDGDTITDAAGRQHQAIESAAWGGIGTAFATEQLAIYRWWFESMSSSHPEIRMINATEGGASIAGWQEMSLNDWDPGHDAIDDKAIAVEVMPTGVWVSALQAQREALKPVSRAAAATSRCIADLVGAWGDSVSRNATSDAALISGYSVGEWNELGSMPRPDQLQTVAKCLDRQAVQAGKLRPLIDAAIKEILK